MTGIAGSVMAEPGAYEKLFTTLTRASHKDYIDLKSFLPWGEGVDRRLPPKAMDQLWIYGTPYFDALTDEQRLEVAWLETARDASMFIHLEHVIPPVYTGYVHDYREDLDRTVYEYLMIFSREELTHIMAFQRFLKSAGLPWYKRPGSYADLSASLPKMRPELGILFTLMIEWTAELAVMHATQFDGVDKLTRSLFHAHHREEARHIAFGKAVGQGFFERAPAEEAAAVRAHLGSLLSGLIPVFNFNPEIAAYTSFRFPIQPTDEAAIRAVQHSRHNHDLNAVRFKELFTWCEGLGIPTPLDAAGNA